MVERPSPVLERSRYTKLTPGTQYAIADRPHADAARATMLATRQAVIQVKLVMPAISSWQERRDVCVGSVTVNTDDRLEFEGVIANGSRLVRVRVAFYGTTDGFIELLVSE